MRSKPRLSRSQRTNTERKEREKMSGSGGKRVFCENTSGRAPVYCRCDERLWTLYETKWPRHRDPIGTQSIICLRLTSHAGFTPRCKKHLKREGRRTCWRKQNRECWGGGGRGKEKDSEEISHIKYRLIQHPAITETANALQRQCNPRCQKAITCG